MKYLACFSADPSVPRQLGASRKESAARRRELLSGGGLGEAIAAASCRNAGSLLRNASGRDIVVEVARGGQGGEHR